MDLTRVENHDAAAAGGVAPVYAVTKGGLAESGAPEELLTLAAMNGFDGAAGGVLAGPEGVLLGIGDGDDPLVYGALSEKLPAGDYRLAARLEDARANLAALAWLLGGYQFTAYRKATPRNARLLAPENVDVAAVRRAAEAAGLIRDLVNTPAGDMLPSHLESAAHALAERFDANISVIVGEALLDGNFHLVHAVGRAADNAPRLIDMHWGDETHPKVTLVGKGVCFDSGGLNIKGAAGMGLMKKDMGGGAHVLGLAHMIMAAGLRVRLRVLIPAVENAVSGNAFRPGDILTSRKGLTVEIGNTDAEGRLVLADALDLAAEEKPDLTISLATLTGAARVAVGPELAPFYTDDEDFAVKLQDAGRRTADPVWRMPLWRGYDEMLSSPIADMNNIASGPFAGSITAALFLRRFAPNSGVWAHFDIYAWRAKAAPGRPVGGAAQAVRALFEVIKERTQ